MLSRPVSEVELRANITEVVFREVDSGPADPVVYGVAVYGSDVYGSAVTGVVVYGSAVYGLAVWGVT